MSSKHPFISGLFALCFVSGVGLASLACGNDSAVKETPAPTPTVTSPKNGPDVSPDGGTVEDCVRNPTTHLEIINACTTSDRVKKDSVLTKLRPDGGLPPLN